MSVDFSVGNNAIALTTCAATVRILVDGEFGSYLEPQIQVFRNLVC